MTETTHVIVGASLAGATAAATLRKEQFDGRIVVIGDETALPYERPELSKKYLRGEPEGYVPVHDPNFYDEASIELRLGTRVRKIDVPRREVELDGDRIHWDSLLLATGARPRRPDLPGIGLDGVVTLRTIADADAIRERAAQAERIVVVGGGWIASEVAASLRQTGRDVTLLLPGRRPLERVLGPEVGEIYRAAHVDHGVKVEAGIRAAAFRGATSVTAVETDNGRSLRADLVVLGVGAEPRTELAAQAGIETADGILVDDQLRTSVVGVFAAGDVANATHPRYGRRIRVEHWDNAKRQGRTAALNMLGRETRYDRIPYFYSDQYDLGMEYRGFAPAWDEIVFRGDPRSGAFLAFWLRDDHVVAAMNMNVWDEGPALQTLVASGAIVDRAHLADAQTPLAEIAVAA